MIRSPFMLQNYAKIDEVTSPVHCYRYGSTDHLIFRESLRAATGLLLVNIIKI
jgi:hypothetical protein